MAKSRTESKQLGKQHEQLYVTVKVTVRLSCGCTFAWPGNPETAPYRGLVLYCYHHEKDATVDRVEMKR